MLEARKEFAIGEIGLNVVLNLLDEVYERLFELMDNFYRITSEYISEQFEEIQALKTRYSNDWGAR